MLVIERCLRRRLGTIVFGWNVGQRQQATLGKNTQDFVQIPTQRLKERIKQLCEFYDIEFVEVEESYTSKCSFLDEDFLPTFGKKINPKGGNHQEKEYIVDCINQQTALWLTRILMALAT